MALVAALAISTRIVFLLLSALTLADALRQRDLARLEIFLVFASLGLSLFFSALAALLGGALPLLLSIGNLAIIAHPFLLLRVSQHFRRTPLWIQTLAAAGMLLSWLVALFIPLPFPLWLSLLVVAYFVGVELYAAAVFLRETWHTHGVRHMRLRLVSLGTALIVLGVLLLIPLELIPSALPAWNEVLNIALYALAIAVGVLYYLGFAPPRSLRRAWQLSELYDYLHGAEGHSASATTNDTLNVLCGGAMRAVGGTAAAALLWDEPTQRLAVCAARPDDTHYAEALADSSGAIARAWQTRKPLLFKNLRGLGAAESRLANALGVTALLCTPIAGGRKQWGVLLVWLPRSPLFAADDQALLALFGEQAAQVLDGAEQLSAERQLAERLDQQRAELETTNSALRRSEEMFSRIFHANPAAICITRQPDGLFLDANASFAQMTGYGNKELEGQTTTSLGLYVNPEDRVTIGTILTRDGTMRNYEMDVRTKDGSVIRVLISMETITLNENLCTLAIMYDISERQRTQQALLRSEAIFSSIFRTSPVAVSITRRSDGRFMDVNEAHSRLMGYPMDEIIGHDVNELGIYARLDERTALMNMLRDGETIRNIELALRHKSGAIIHCLVSLESIMLDGVPCVLGITIDITQRRQAEEAIQQLNAELRARTAQLEAANQELQTFSYSVSHDLRAPLRTINGFSTALQEDYGDKIDATGKDYLERIRTGVVRMSELIEALLSLSRAAQGEIRLGPVDLSALVRGLMQEAQRREPERQVNATVAENIVVSGDNRLLQTALTNLIDNAFKYTGKKPVACIEFGTMQKDNEAVYFVRDNGAGFDMAYADKLFGAFQRLHKASEFPGTGIGLATVQRIVRRHGGRIWAESAVEQGTTIYFTLATGAVR